jgi:hypothetical protein
VTIKETISRLARATAEEGDNSILNNFGQRALRRFAASLPAGVALMFEQILESLARAAEELPDDATPLEIRDRARLIRRRPN